MPNNDALFSRYPFFIKEHWFGLLGEMGIFDTVWIRSNPKRPNGSKRVTEYKNLLLSDFHIGWISGKGVTVIAGSYFNSP
jgi:hypothetical protein